MAGKLPGARSVEHEISDYRSQRRGLGCRSRDHGGTRAIRPCGEFCSVTRAHGGETRLVCTHGYLERLPRMLRMRFRLSHDVWQSHDGRLVQSGGWRRSHARNTSEMLPLSPVEMHGHRYLDVMNIDATAFSKRCHCIHIHCNNLQFTPL